MGEEDAPDPDYFLECYGRMAVNSFHVMDENQVGKDGYVYFRVGPAIVSSGSFPCKSSGIQQYQQHISSAQVQVELKKKHTFGKTGSLTLYMIVIHGAC